MHLNFCVTSIWYLNSMTFSRRVEVLFSKRGTAYCKPLTDCRLNIIITRVSNMTKELQTEETILAVRRFLYCVCERMHTTLLWNVYIFLSMIFDILYMVVKKHYFLRNYPLFLWERNDDENLLCLGEDLFDFPWKNWDKTCRTNVNV
jgi:hypothetical protein